MATKTVVFTSRPADANTRLQIRLADGTGNIQSRLLSQTVIETTRDDSPGAVVRDVVVASVNDVQASGFWPAGVTAAQFRAILGAFRNHALDQLGITGA